MYIKISMKLNLCSPFGRNGNGSGSKRMDLTETNFSLFLPLFPWQSSTVVLPLSSRKCRLKVKIYFPTTHVFLGTRYPLSNVSTCVAVCKPVRGSQTLIFSSISPPETVTSWFIILNLTATSYSGPIPSLCIINYWFDHYGVFYFCSWNYLKVFTLLICVFWLSREL